MPSRYETLIAGFLAALGFAFAALNLAALSWDGGWYFFRTLQDGAPLIVSGRYSDYGVLWAVMQAGKFVHDPRTLAMLYGLLLAVFPLGALGLSWFYLHGNLAPLRIWPALGILLVPLPGQFCMVAEAILAAQLLWPILAILAGASSRAAHLWLALLAGFSFFLHPTSSVVFGIAAIVCAARAFESVEHRRRLIYWGAVFAVLAVARGILSAIWASEYERSEMTTRQLETLFLGWFGGYAPFLVVIVYLWGADTIRLARERLPNRLSHRSWMVMVISAAIIGWLWASNPGEWWKALDYRRFVLVFSLPVAGMAAWHYRRLGTADALPRGSHYSLCWVAAIFMLILGRQSMTWHSLLERLTDELAQRQQRVVTRADLSFIQRTPLDHWAACPLSLELQGRRPRSVLVSSPADAHPDFIEVLPLNDIPLEDHWFLLRQMQEK